MNKQIETKLLAASQSKFELSWDKEVERYRALFNRYMNEVVTPNDSETWNGSRTSGFQIARNQFFISLFGRRISELKETQYKQAHALDSFLLNCSTKGFDVVVNGLKEDFINGLTYKMIQAFEKHVDAKFTDITDINLFNTPKGYSITAKLISKDEIAIMDTNCIMAGGYNVQCLHYRYITKLS